MEAPCLLGIDEEHLAGFTEGGAQSEGRTTNEAATTCRLCHKDLNRDLLVKSAHHVDSKIEGIVMRGARGSMSLACIDHTTILRDNEVRVLVINEAIFRDVEIFALEGQSVASSEDIH